MTTSTTATPNRDRMTTGMVLIALGVLFFAAQAIDLSNLFLPVLALVFIAAGVAQRKAGPLVPGGILLGLGVGIFLSDTAFQTLAEPGDGGLIVACLGGGFMLITVLSALFTPEVQWWGLIPGTILAVIGGALLAGGAALDVLALLGKVWPVFLIIGGAAMLVKRQS